MCSSKANHQPSLSNSLILTISKFQIMKKTYIIPEMLSVQLGTRTSVLQATSLPVVGGGEEVDDPNDILTKEQKGTNVWDEEW